MPASALFESSGGCNERTRPQSAVFPFVVPFLFLDRTRLPRKGAPIIISELLALRKTNPPSLISIGEKRGLHAQKMWMLKLPEGAEWLWIKVSAAGRRDANSQPQGLTCSSLSFPPHQGPIVQVGRAPEAGISVATDKSISRLHVQLEVDHASPGGDLLIRDLGSRFGSTLDGVRIAPNADHRVAASHGARPVELVIGGASYTMLLKFVSMSFCLTRMDKKQKEVLKVSNERQLTSPSSFLRSLLLLLTRRNSGALCLEGGPAPWSRHC